MTNKINEKCCTCTTPEITIKLNKQGPQGLTGPKGEDGFSPVINVETSNYSTYTLNITDGNGTFTTPNLKASIPGIGLQGDVLTKNSNVEGDYSFQPLPLASNTTNGTVTLATYNDILNPNEDNEDNVITNNVMDQIIQGMVQPKGNYVTTDTEQLITGRKTFQDRIITDGGIYHSVPTASPSYGEILKYNNEKLVLGNKYDELLINFKGKVQFYNGLINSRRDITINSGDIPRQEVLQVNYGEDVYNVITNGDIATATSLGIVKPDGSTITVDPDGTIHSQGGGAGGAVIDDANVSTTTVYSSNKTVQVATSLVTDAVTLLNQTIQELQARVQTLEEQIDGGKA